MILYGKRIFEYLLSKHPQKIKRLYLSKKPEGAVERKLKKLSIPIVYIDNKKAQSLARGGNHQGYLVETEEYSYADWESVKNGDFTVVLWGVTDIGNIGSIIRTSYALGVNSVILTGIKSSNPSGFIRTSSGAALDMEVALFPDGYDLINRLKTSGFALYCSTLEGGDIRTIRFGGKRALVLGSEGEGVPKKVEKSCDYLVKIEMARDFDSLNVSAAAAIMIDRMRQ